MLIFPSFPLCLVPWFTSLFLQWTQLKAIWGWKGLFQFTASSLWWEVSAETQGRNLEERTEVEVVVGVLLSGLLPMIRQACFQIHPRTLCPGHTAPNKLGLPTSIIKPENALQSWLQAIWGRCFLNPSTCSQTTLTCANLTISNQRIFFTTILVSVISIAVLYAICSLIISVFFFFLLNQVSSRFIIPKHVWNLPVS